MNGLNGIIVDGKVYEVVDSGTTAFECKDCAIREKCDLLPGALSLCFNVLPINHHFRYSKELTDKINRQTPKTYEEDEGCVRRK